MAFDRPRLPKIVRFLGIDDCPDSSCPHCGATGRYIHTFIVEDGRHLAAMSGCVKLFPVSPVAAEAHRLAKKKSDYAKRGYRLASWDMRIEQAIADYEAGLSTEADTLESIRRAKSAADAWRRSRRFR